MESFFFEHKQARKIVYAIILALWLTTLLIRLSSPTPKQVAFAVVGYPLVAIISYLLLKLSLSSMYLLTKKIEIYKRFYWIGLMGSFFCIIMMADPNSEIFGEASLMTFFCIAMAWVSRAIYFDFQEYTKN